MVWICALRSRELVRHGRTGAFPSRLYCNNIGIKALALLLLGVTRMIIPAFERVD